MPILEKTTANRKKIKTMFVLVSADLAFAEVKNYKKKSSERIFALYL
jgi:hypothetical protein